MVSPQALSEQDRRTVAAWAADCAEHVLPLFEAEDPNDGRPRDAIARTRAFARGELGAAEEIRRRFVAGRAAGDVKDPAAVAAARSAAQAAGVAHMGAHALGAAAYAAKAAGLSAPDHPEAMADEIRWQLGSMTPSVRAALRRLPLLGEDSSGPLGNGLLASGVLGAVIRELQSALHAASAVFTDPDSPVPAGLATEVFTLRPIVAADAARDFDAVVETRELLRLWEQSDWPADDFTVEDNRADLVDLENRHGEHRAFTYTVIDPDDTECLGCVYIFPPTATFLAKSEVTAVGDGVWADVDAVVYFWVRRSQLETSMDGRLLAALRRWFAHEWGFARTVFATNEQFEQQVDLVRRTELTLQFELREPDKVGTFLLFG